MFTTANYTNAKFIQYGTWLLIGACASSAFSIALLQAFSLGFLLYWLAFLWANHPNENFLTDDNSSKLLFVPTIFFVLVSVLSSLSGVYPIQSLVSVLQSAPYLFLPFAMFTLARLCEQEQKPIESIVRKLMIALVAGHGLGCALRVITCATGDAISFGTPGPVTQSGQLVLVIPLALALLAALSEDQLRFLRSRVWHLLGIIGTVVLFIWPPAAVISGEILILFRLGLACLFALIVATSFMGARDRASLNAFLLGVATALLISVLLLNLKRGPWLAVFVEALIIGALFSRRLILYAIFLVVTAVTIVPPIRDRGLAFVDDFVIAGGRKTMWALGGELAQRYPLGLGPRNARYMREIDHSLPVLHRHMHNNFLNVAVETGWIGLSIFLWWLVSIVRLAFGQKTACRQWIFSALLGTALIGWQVAGLVEYNFGDGEVRIVALMLVGLVLISARKRARALAVRAEESSTPPSSQQQFSAAQRVA